MTIGDLIGVPYAMGGRGPSAYDCAGLVIECQRRQGYAVEIPSTGETKVSDHLAMRRILQLAWQELPHPEPGCVVFFPAEAHVGTMLDQRRFLHTTREMGSAFLESLESPHWKCSRRHFYKLLPQFFGGSRC